jgi:hypothetical protein
VEEWDMMNVDVVQVSLEIYRQTSKKGVYNPEK